MLCDAIYHNGYVGGCVVCALLHKNEVLDNNN